MSRIVERHIVLLITSLTNQNIDSKDIYKIESTLSIAMNVKIDNEEVLKNAMVDGINLFTGAGFSILPNIDGDKLPLGPQYAEELKDKFGITIPGNDLDDVADIMNGDSLQEYTRKRFKVSKINPKYYLINKLNLKSFITTNYDNIPLLINEKNDTYKLYDVRSGPQNGQSMVKYIPIHGNVESDEYPIIIGSLSVVSLNTFSSAAMNEAEKAVSQAPTIIWGYGMKDKSTLQIFKSTIENQSQNIWIQCLEGDERIEYYRGMHFNIILADTESLLNWIANNITAPTQKEKTIVNDPDLLKFKVPLDISEVKSYESDDYYNYGITQWFHIFSNLAYERAVVTKIHNEALKIKHVIVVGSDFSGKTTILMQLSRKINSPNKFFFDNITTEMVNYVASKIKDHDAWVFLDNCADLEQLNVLSKLSNTTLVSTTTEYLFESEKNKITLDDYKIINVTEIDGRLEAQKIREIIPKNLRTADFTYKMDKDEKYSMIELVTGNVKSALSKTMVRRILDHIKEVSKESFELIALTVYLSKRSSAVNTEVLLAYYELTTYEEVKEKIDKVNSLLRELNKINIQIESDDFNQDFFVMRSGLFLNKCVELFESNKGIPDYHATYARMIRRFIEYVSPIHIWNYEIFKKKQYDSELFYIIFGDTADDLYDELYKYSNNIFVIQQKALYHRRCKKYKLAFEEISKTLMALPKNPSVKNSYAMILFEMNDEEKGPNSLDMMRKAMTIFEELHENDERKLYHTEKYSQYAIKLAETYSIKDYLDNAISWIDSLDAQQYNSNISALRSKLMELKNKN